jgi:hypothetical protein
MPKWTPLIPITDYNMMVYHHGTIQVDEHFESLLQPLHTSGYLCHKAIR